MLTIRMETPSDYKEVYDLVTLSFATAEHADGDEQDLVERLRGSASFIPQLSLVAVQEDKIIGHIMFTIIGLGGVPAVTLAPLAIHPGYQRQGIGMQLMQEGHRIAREMGYCFSVLVGHEHYYPRAGYLPAAQLGITTSMEVPAVNFMALDLQGGTPNPNSMVEYAKEFF